MDMSDRFCKALVAIREDEIMAGRPFFDVAPDRLCIIDRDRNHKFLAEKFRERLEKMIDEALSFSVEAISFRPRRVRT